MLDTVLGIMIELSNLKTEVQVSICDSKTAVAQKLDLGNWNKKKTVETYYLEDTDLDLFNQGWVIRMRLNRSAKEVEVTVKNNQYNNFETASKVKDCEFDLHGDTKKLACKMKNIISQSDFEKAQKTKDWGKVLNKAQMDWLNSENIILPADVSFVGSINDEKFETTINKDLVTLGISTTQNDKEFIEISARTDEKDELKTQQEILSFLIKNDISICSDQSNRFTREKLESLF